MPGPSGDNASGPEDLTINELVLAYLRFTDGYYRKNGKPTSDVRDICLSVRPLRQCSGSSRLGTSGLSISKPFVRRSSTEVSAGTRSTNGPDALFGWGVEEAIVPSQVHWGLKAVKGLKKGRSGVRESEPVKPVPDAFVDAVKPWLMGRNR